MPADTYVPHMLKMKHPDGNNYSGYGCFWHVYSNRSLFYEYQKVADGEGVFMGNFSTTKILGKKLTYVKIVFE